MRRAALLVLLASLPAWASSYGDPMPLIIGYCVVFAAGLMVPVFGVALAILWMKQRKAPVRAFVLSGVIGLVASTPVLLLSGYLVQDLFRAIPIWVVVESIVLLVPLWLCSRPLTS